MESKTTKTVNHKYNASIEILIKIHGINQLGNYFISFPSEKSNTFLLTV